MDNELDNAGMEHVALAVLTVGLMVFTVVCVVGLLAALWLAVA